MGCGRPVVATANDSLPELMDDGVNGLVVPRGDVAAPLGPPVAPTRGAERRRTLGTA
jgi:Glycosyl transferases group 1